MAATLRDAWQQVKKANPDIVKDRAFKGDLGPQLDKLDKLIASILQSEAELNKQLGVLEKAATNIAAVVDAYRKTSGDTAKEAINAFSKVMNFQMSEIRTWHGARTEYMKQIGGLLH
jgi:hypothetical protein